MEGQMMSDEEFKPLMTKLVMEGFQKAQAEKDNKDGVYYGKIVA